MSWKATAAVKQFLLDGGLDGLKTGHAAILYVLADECQDDFSCHPSLGRIARACCMERRSVIRNLRDLQKMQPAGAGIPLLTVEERVRPNSSQSTNLYTLHLPSVVLQADRDARDGGGDDKLSPSPPETAAPVGGDDARATGGVTPTSPGGDAHVMGGVTPTSPPLNGFCEPSCEPPPPPPTPSTAGESDFPFGANAPTTGGGGEDDEKPEEAGGETVDLGELDEALGVGEELLDLGVTERKVSAVMSTCDMAVIAENIRRFRWLRDKTRSKVEIGGMVACIERGELLSVPDAYGGCAKPHTRYWWCECPACHTGRVITTGPGGEPLACCPTCRVPACASSEKLTLIRELREDEVRRVPEEEARGARGT